VLKNPANHHKAVSLTYEQWHYAFTNTFDEGESRRLYERYGPDVIVSCGSGVTACHDALAIELAGLPPARLYVGSFSGWIEDPDRPVATGPEPG